ncbi:MAG: helix-turn-helix domain-containing protein [Clostridium sp.]|nr:helix-turn-helix domain-containing protein [Clostridium sp.]
MNNRIKELRNEKRITQLQLSIELGVTQETISAYEHNKHYPSVSALIKMTEIFEASMDYIMGLSVIRANLPEVDSSFAEQKAYLSYCYQKLGSKNKTKLLSYAQGLVDSEKE